MNAKGTLALYCSLFDAVRVKRIGGRRVSGIGFVALATGLRTLGSTLLRNGALVNFATKSLPMGNAPDSHQDLTYGGLTVRYASSISRVELWPEGIPSNAWIQSDISGRRVLVCWRGPRESYVDVFTPEDGLLAHHVLDMQALAIAASAADDRLLVLAANASAHIFELESGQAVGQLQGPAECRHCAIGQASIVLASVAHPRAPSALSMEARISRYVLNEHAPELWREVRATINEPIVKLAVSHDGRHIAVAGDKTVRLLGPELETLRQEPLSSPVSLLRFVEGQRLLVGLASGYLVESFTRDPYALLER